MVGAIGTVGTIGTIVTIGISEYICDVLKGLRSGLSTQPRLQRYLYRLAINGWPSAHAPAAGNQNGGNRPSNRPIGAIGTIGSIAISGAMWVTCGSLLHGRKNNGTLLSVDFWGWAMVGQCLAVTKSLDKFSWVPSFHPSIHPSFLSSFHPPNGWPTVGQRLANGWTMIDHLEPWLTMTTQWLANGWPMVGQRLANGWPMVGP